MSERLDINTEHSNPSDASPRKFHESPWFWLLAFGAAAFLGLWAIAGKYEQRERRIEMKFAGRREANERIAKGEAVDPRANVPQTAPHAVAERNDDVDVTPEQVRNAKTLGFLQWVAAGAAIIGAGMTIYEQRMLRTERTEAKP
ncbi:MAG: hypothetical protein QM811_01370 [Pirellulales bacterium]